VGGSLLRSQVITKFHFEWHEGFSDRLIYSVPTFHSRKSNLSPRPVFIGSLAIPAHGLPTKWPIRTTADVHSISL
jgi:hypothetical protein